jgi:hypothetical protein
VLQYQHSYLRAEPQLTMVAYSPLLKGGYVNQVVLAWLRAWPQWTWS